MRTVKLPLPKMAFIIVTRAALAAGVGLLVAGRLTAEHRRRAGLALVALGAATTIPAVSWVTRSLQCAR